MFYILLIFIIFINYYYFNKFLSFDAELLLGLLSLCVFIILSSALLSSLKYNGYLKLFFLNKNTQILKNPIKFFFFNKYCKFFSIKNIIIKKINNKKNYLDIIKKNDLNSLLNLTFKGLSKINLVLYTNLKNNWIFVKTFGFKAGEIFNWYLEDFFDSWNKNVLKWFGLIQDFWYIKNKKKCPN